MTRDTVRVAYLCLQATREGQASHAHVHEIIRGLKTRGFDVDLFQPRYADGRGALPGALGRALEFRRVQRELARRAAGPAAVYIRAHFAAGPTARWAARHGIPVVQEVNGAYEDLFAAWPWTRHFRRYFEGLMRTQYRNADALITVTGDLASWLTVDTGREDVAVIPNGANTELFTPSAKPMRGLPEKYVVFFGAFAMWQGLDTLVAASEDQEWPADVALLLAGDGAARPLVEEAASRNPRIRYLGTISYEDMPGLVVGSIAGVSPQGHAGGRSEAGLSPLKVFETLSCGVPVVVTDFPGQAELVRDNNVGYVIPADDPKSLARAVKALVANPDKAHKMGMRGRGLIETSHSWDSRAGATAKILEGVIARRKAMS